MARLTSYDNDTALHDEDLLTGSNYISVGKYNTRNFKLRDLAGYFANFYVQEGSLYNLATISQSIETNVTNISANASFSTNLSATFGTFDEDGNLITLAESFANQVFSVTSSTTFATSSYLNAVTSSFGTFDSSGNLTSLSQSFANNVMTTTNNARFAESTYVNNLGSSFGTLASDGSVTISEAFADSVITTTASNRFATTTSVNTLTSTVEGKPDVFRQDDAPATTNPVGSIWYDTNDDNKVYVLVSGTPNVWTETSDDRIVTNSQSISSVNQSVTTLSNSLSAEAALIDELQTQFTFDTNGGITGTADALATSITTASSNAAGAVASDLDKLEAVFTFDSNNDVSGVAGALNTSINTAASTASNAVATDLDKLEAVFTFDSNNNVDGIQGSLSTAVTSNANTAISNASLASASDVTELQSQFTFTNGNITGVTDALATSISTTASNAAGAVATDLDKLEAVFSFDSNGNVDGTAGALSTAVTSSANTAIANASLATAQSVTDLTSTVNTKPQIFRQTSQPSTTGVPNNSLWYDTDDDNKLYVLVSSTWTATVDGTIATAQQAANTAQSTADGRPKVFRQTSAPATTEPASSIWYDTDDDNKIYILVSGTWTATDDPRIATNVANISSQQTVVTRLDGHSKAAYSLTATANDVVTGMRIIAADNSVDTTSEVKFQADKFIVNSASTNLTPFSISGSKIQFNGDITVSGTALIKGSVSSGDYIAAKFKNTDTTNNAGAGISLNSSSDYHHRILMTGGNTSSLPDQGTVFDLNASYQLGQDGQYSKQVLKMNGSGIIIPNQSANGITASANYSGGMNIIFNDNNGGRTGSSGRLHVNEYYKTFFLDVPGVQGSAGTWQDKVFVMRAHNGTGDQTVFDVDTNRKITTVGALEVGGNFNGQNAYFNQDVGIGFTSGNIGGKLDIVRSNVGINIKNQYATAGSGTIGLFGYTSSNMNTSGAYHMVFQADNGSSVTNMLLCDLNGNLRNYNNSYGQISDISLKENIVAATPKLEEVKQLEVKNFNFIGNDLKQIGLIAQDVEQIFPGLVENIETPEGDEIKSVKYSVLVPILIKAIQELEARVAQLETP
jgi:hypothetical protein